MSEGGVTLVIAVKQYAEGIKVAISIAIGATMANNEKTPKRAAEAPKGLKDPKAGPAQRKIAGPSTSQTAARRSPARQSSGRGR